MDTPTKKRRYDFLGETTKTVTTIAGLMKIAYRYDALMVDEMILLHVQDYPEQYPYLLLMSKTKFDAVCCLLFSENCGGGGN